MYGDCRQKSRWACCEMSSQALRPSGGETRRGRRVEVRPCGREGERQQVEWRVVLEMSQTDSLSLGGSTTHQVANGK